jgi:mannose-6-phosphate isomerase-like protein (cupin superfamily)
MEIRRVVAGVDGDGRSVVLSDGPVPHTLDYQYMPGQGHARIWRTDGPPTQEPPAEEPTSGTGPMLPAPGGVNFLVLQVAPDSFVTDPRFDPAKSGEEFATYAPDMAAVMEPDNPGMHRTDTVDFAVVLDGEVTMETGDGTKTRLTAGDTVVQLGSRHAWRNQTDRPATVAFVLTGVQT